MLATELFKVKNGLSPPFMNKIFVENAQHYYDLRKKAEFKRTNVKTVYNGTETLTFLGPRIWEIVPDYIKKSNSFEEIKLKIKLWNPENCPCRLCKRFLPLKLVFHNMPFNFYATYYIIFKSHFLFCQFQIGFVF